MVWVSIFSPPHTNPRLAASSGFSQNECLDKGVCAASGGSWTSHSRPSKSGAAPCATTPNLPELPYTIASAPLFPAEVGVMH